MVVSVKPVMHAPLKEAPTKEVIREWHLVVKGDSLCKELVKVETDKHFLPEGARVCIKCVNALLRLVDLQ